MKKALIVLVSILLMSAFAIPVSAAPLSVTAQNYTVLVGAENVKNGVGLMSFFPGTLTVHVGDTVTWKVQTHEIHTVTFLAGGALPDLQVQAPGFPQGAMMINPLAAFPTAPSGSSYDGSSYVNSGILSTDPGNETEYSLVFTKAGTYPYICLVHGVMMSGTVNVVDASVAIPSPADVSAAAQHQVLVQLAQGQVYQGLGQASVPAPVHHADGTTAYTVEIGYSAGNADLMSFFPDKLVVHPGDTVNFVLSPTNTEAPHTVTFLNGTEDISFVDPVPSGGPYPLLLLNPEVVFPSQLGVPLSHSGVYSSGLLVPGSPNTSYSLTIGNELGTYDYECLLHDTSGMTGVLKVVPR